jgi:5'-nucleotidase
MLKILVSNDDGVHAPGIQALAQALEAIATVTTVAPDRNCSAASSALTLQNPLRVEQMQSGFYAVNGTPVDSAYLGLSYFCEAKPDMVVSGINAGANMGNDVIYSGTVAAALQGRYQRLPAVAISLDGTKHYATAAQVAVDVVKWLQSLDVQEAQVINVNVPDVPYAMLKGMQITRLGQRAKAGKMVKSQDPAGRDLYWVGPAGLADASIEGTDFHAVASGYVSVTPLHFDVTHHASLAKLKDAFEPAFG